MKEIEKDKKTIENFLILNKKKLRKKKDLIELKIL